MEKENMKYTIGAVQQKQLINYDLDIKDAFIITYLKEITTSKKLINKTIAGKKYVWIDYQSLIDYLPALKINSKDVIARRMAKYEKIGLIKKHLHKTMAYGVYTFFHLEEKFNTMFEIQKVEKDDSELEKIKEKMGLLGQQNEESTEKSSGFDSKVETTPTEKSRHNTPNKILQTKDSSSTAAASSEETFFKTLKDLLIKDEFKNHNFQTLKNIENYSNGSLEEVKKVIEFMKLKKKAVNSKVLVAILKDGDHKVVEPVEPQKVTKADKLAHMLKVTTQDEINDLCNRIAESFGFEEYEKLNKSDENIVNIELERILCNRYNKLKTM